MRAVRTRIFNESEDLAAFIIKGIPKLKDGSILTVASKIVALSEGRVVRINDKKAKEALIRAESEWQEKVLSKWWLTIRDGTVVVNAGIDDSNAAGNTILLPEDCFASAESLRKALKKKYGIKKLGIIITDSRITPLRAGVTGVALGYAGFRGVYDYRGKKDIFDRTLKVTQTNIADSLASAATVVMGEGAEQQPLAVIEDAPVQFIKNVDRNELRMEPAKDMFRSLFAKRASRKKK